MWANGMKKALLSECLYARMSLYQSPCHTENYVKNIKGINTPRFCSRYC